MESLGLSGAASCWFQEDQKEVQEVDVGLDAWLRVPVASRAPGERACNIGARARIKTTTVLPQSCST